MNNITQDKSRPHIFIWDLRNNPDILDFFNKSEKGIISLFYPLEISLPFENFDKFSLDTSIQEYHYLEYVQPKIVLFQNKIELNIRNILTFNIGFTLKPKKYLVLDENLNMIEKIPLEKKYVKYIEFFKY